MPLKNRWCLEVKMYIFPAFRFSYNLYYDKYRAGDMMFLEELVIVVIIGKFSLSSPFISTF